MNTYLPRDRVYIPELDVTAVVVSVYITTDGIEYKCRYFKDGMAIESYLYDFEVNSGKEKTVA